MSFIICFRGRHSWKINLLNFTTTIPPFLLNHLLAVCSYLFINCTGLLLHLFLQSLISSYLLLQNCILTLQCLEFLIVDQINYLSRFFSLFFLFLLFCLDSELIGNQIVADPFGKILTLLLLLFRLWVLALFVLALLLNLFSLLPLYWFN
jgi:hypothetical protein